MFCWAKRIVFLTIILIVIFGLYLFIPIKINPSDNITWGITFTKSYAQYLGLDWKQTYLAALDDLGIKAVRIGVNWDEIEATQGQFDFTDYDWMFDQAEKRGITVLPAIGFKLPRWPECRAPEWAAQWLPKDAPLWKRMFDIGVGAERGKFEQAQMKMIETVVKHFKTRQNIIMWQVENEGFIGWFGDCPPTKDDFVRSEIEFIRSLDPRPILLTESGELSSGFKSARVANVVGTSLYREVLSSVFGQMTYPLPSSFYAHKAKLLKPWSPRFIITELQLEAWAKGGILNMPIEEQIKAMAPEKMRTYIDYARRTGIDEIYTWGAEWWWWLKLQGYPQLWETARQELNGYQVK